ncbi:hypothetical protein PUMCH_003139 [Australozyma saopauloensis]|uniref:Uncharacterized protein n=1 Tax=Australozyma saopauloensis TaxID=291208 RepID=A0AAX4HB48_9ASCO|nr:hypothetical protein PUMCH_003139 [[Candida] saopauloensis]
MPTQLLVANPHISILPFQPPNQSIETQKELLNTMLRFQHSMFCNRIILSRSMHRPPSYFNDPLAVPKPFNNASNVPASAQIQDDQPNGDDIPPPTLRSMKDFAMVLASLTLAYLAVDNYKSRVKIEKMSQETAAINMKTLQLQQQSFAGAVKKQELRILNERMVTSKRCFKMALHIAMLRRQLAEKGIDPTTIDEVAAEFDKSVKMSNGSPGSLLWLDDDSKFKPDLPDYREYDRKGNE